MILDCTKYTGLCECGRDHELRTKLVVCEYGALKNFDKYMDDCGLTGFRTVIYDTNTYNLPTMHHVRADQEPPRGRRTLRFSDHQSTRKDAQRA